MLEKVEATRFDRAMTKGRTMPLLLAAEYSDGRSVELIGKFSHGGQIGPIGLAREAISAMLAADLGLPVPKRMLAQSAEIFAFDALIQNADQHPKNPNMQVKGEEVAIYDHELAFIWEGVLFWKPPWESGGLDNIAQPDRHVFYTAIKGQTLDFSRLIGVWEAISDVRLAEYQAALPAEWNGASAMIGKVLGFVRQLRDNVRPAMHGNAKGVDMNKQAYSYSVLRYVHDVTTGEFVNVGLALYCPAMHYANAACRTTSKRLTPLFPSLDSSMFRALMRKVQTRFEALHDEVRSQLELRSYASVMELAHSVIPQDDSALQWAPMGSGLTSDPDATLELLFDRFVMKHDETSTVHRRNDEHVWKNFSRELEQQQVLKHFKPKHLPPRTMKSGLTGPGKMVFGIALHPCRLTCPALNRSATKRTSG